MERRGDELFGRKANLGVGLENLKFSLIGFLFLRFFLSYGFPWSKPPAPKTWERKISYWVIGLLGYNGTSGAMNDHEEDGFEPRRNG